MNRAFFLDSSSRSGERMFYFQEAVFFVSKAIGHSFDGFDIVVDAFFFLEIAIIYEE